MRDLTRVLVVLLLTVATTASSCLRSADDVARAGDDALRAAATSGDNLATAAPRLGDDLRNGIRELSEDEDVQDAVYSLAWNVMCDVVAGEIPRSVSEIADYVAAIAIDFGLEFTSEGTQALGEAVIDELDGADSQIAETCAELQL